VANLTIFYVAMGAAATGKLFLKKTPTAFRRHIAQIRVSNAAGMWGAKEE